MMTIGEMKAKVQEIYAQYEDEYYYIGLRFEDKLREVGDICEYSKANDDREDEREFPEYGTEEYEELPELNGTSAWDLAALPVIMRYIFPSNDNAKASTSFVTKHAYIIASNRQGSHPHPDDNEILIQDAEVISVLF